MRIPLSIIVMYNGDMAIVNCKLCNKEIYRRPSSLKIHSLSFCSKFCEFEYKKSLRPEANCICKNCGKEFRTNPAYIRRTPNQNRFCSYECHHTFMRGEVRESEYIDASGYKIVLGLTCEKRTRYHRWIMEEKLGRKLKKTEHVHHINGNRLDNRLENLMVLDEKVHHSIESIKMWKRRKKI